MWTRRAIGGLATKLSKLACASFDLFFPSDAAVFLAIEFAVSVRRAWFVCAAIHSASRS